MTWLAAALGVWAVFGFLAFRLWLKARYSSGETALAQQFGRRLSAVEERLSTLELQRAILRRVPNK